MRAVNNVSVWLPKLTALVVGPGMGRDPLMLECASMIITEAKKLEIPLVLDGVR